jgi:hypothetical protein
MPVVTDEIAAMNSEVSGARRSVVLIHEWRPTR